MFLLTLCLVWTASVWAAPVTRVEVQITDNNNRTSPILLRKMEDSMRVVAEQLFNGKDETMIRGIAGEYERLLTEISERVITGYQTNGVRVTTVPGPSGSTAQICFSVAPWAQVVERTETDIQFSGISPLAVSLLQARLPELEQQLRATLSGVSLDATDWAGGVLRGQVQKLVETVLPDFKAAVDVTTHGDTAVVQVIIYPVGELVQDVEYSMESKSIPNLLLMDLKYRYADKAKSLRGLPLSYLIIYPVGELVQDVEYSMESKSIPNLLLMDLKYRYADKAKSLRGLPLSYLVSNRTLLEQRFTEELAGEAQVKRHDLRPKVEIVPGSDTRFTISLESDRYKIWFEGYGDIGRDDHNLSGRAHLGKFISRRDEIFGEAGVDLKDVDWDFSAGYAMHFGKATLSYMRRVPSDFNVYRGEYDFTPKWRFRYEHFGNTGTNEYAVRYRIHEFLSGEYVYSTDKSYFRIIGNL